jgi:hypothetical protein
MGECLRRTAVAPAVGGPDPAGRYQLPARSDLLFGHGALAAHALVSVRSDREPEITAEERQLVAEALRRTNIAIPASKPDPYDPTGKLAWMDRPNSLTRGEAVEYVLSTPIDGEPVRGPASERS